MENEKNTNKNSSSIMVWIIIGILVVAAIVVVIVTTSTTTTTTDPLVSPDTPVEIGDPNYNNEMIVGEINDEDVDRNDIEIKEIEGANRIINNVVLTDDGRPTRNDVEPFSELAPKESRPLIKEELGDDVIILDISSNGFMPNEFTVNAGDAITVALSSVDQWSHSIKFDDPNLRAIVVTASPFQTRAIRFNAPIEPGEYTFRCNVPGHARRGEVGVMIVQ